MSRPGVFTERPVVAARPFPGYKAALFAPGRFFGMMRAPPAPVDKELRAAMSEPIRILGIDPGLRRTGWGLITVTGTRLAFVASGTVTSNGDDDLATRLRTLHEGLTKVVSTLLPDEAAVEETFVNKDAQATLKLGHARAVALLVPALAGLPVAEYAANLVKKTVVGAGHAEKDQVGAMVRFLLPKATADTADAADALAIAITHASHRAARMRTAAHAAAAGPGAARIARAVARG